MKRIKRWLTSKRLLMAQMSDLSRQLTEAWYDLEEMQDARDVAREISVELAEQKHYLQDQLHRVARERDQERKLRLEAEDRLLDYHLDGREKNEIDRKTDGLCEEAQNWKDAYLQLNQQYVEDLETMSNEEE